jgi:PHP family Zn ribbon phosphoesterase
MVTSSDAHFITDIGRKWTQMHLAEGTIDELNLAFQRQAGRFIAE